jgi:hypothetical protein
MLQDMRMLQPLKTDDLWNYIVPDQFDTVVYNLAASLTCAQKDMEDEELENSSALLNESRFNKKKSLSHPDDVKKVSTHVQEEAKKFDSKLLTFENFRKACQIAEVRLMICNMRQSSQLEAIL